MVGGDGSEFYFSHRAPCVKGMNQAIIMAPKEKPAVATKSSCTYCELTRHKVADCGDFQRDYLRGQPQQTVLNRSHHVRQHTHRLIRWTKTNRRKNGLTDMTYLGEPKVESPEALEVDNLPEAIMLLEEMIRVIPVLLRPIVMDPIPHPPIRETSLAVASATGVEKRRTSTIDDMQL